MRKELEGFSPEELEQAAQEARNTRAEYWDRRLADPNDNFDGFDFTRATKPRPTKPAGSRATVGLRLAPGELGIIERAAKTRGVTFSEFVREAALAVASGALPEDKAEAGRLLSNLRLRAIELDKVIDEIILRGHQTELSEGRFSVSSRSGAALKIVDRRTRDVAPPHPPSE